MSEEEEFYDMICFVASSARGIIDEPQHYCPARMMDLLERMLDMLVEQGKSNEVYDEVLEYIKDSDFYSMDLDEQAECIDEIVLMLLEYD